MRPQDRPLWARTADTAEGRKVLDEARALSFEHPQLTDGQLIRLAYWGVPGEQT